MRVLVELPPVLPAGLVGIEDPGRENSEASGIRDRGDELGSADPAHSGKDDGMLDTEQLGDTGLHRVPPRWRRRAGAV